MVRLKDGLIWLCFLIGSVVSVKREDFKTCDQSAFCKRHRAISEPTGYEALSESFEWKDSLITATVKSRENELDLRIYGLEDSTFRIQIDEPSTALRKRFVPTAALDGEPRLKRFSAMTKEANQTIIIAGDNKSKAIVYHSPFMIEVFNAADEIVLQINKNGKLKIEEFRKREEGKVYPEGFWEENFKNYRDSKPFGSSSVGVDVSFIGFKYAFGLPEHADSFALKETVGFSDPYRLYNLDVFEYELHNPMSLYVAIPYILAHRKQQSVGVLWLNSAETWIDTSASSASIIRSVLNKTKGPHFNAHFMSETGVIDLFVFLGPTPQKVQQQYSSLTGRTPLPPLFAIGYHQCRWNYNDEEDVLNVNEKFDEYDIPADVIWLDIEHTDGKKYFTWDGKKFPNPEKMISVVAEKGRKMVTIVDPHIKKDNGYSVYKDAKELGLFVKKTDGVTDFEGHCWPGASEYLDFLHPKTRIYWAEQFSFSKYHGSTADLFTWNDMNEPSVFSGPEVTMDKDCRHYGDVEHREIHNMYGMLYHSASFEGLLQRTAGRDRPFLLTRSGFIGTQRSAAIWTGDNTADWGHLTISIPMLLSLSIAGNSFVGADVGGFFGNPDEQLLTRWYQMGAFQPFFRAHSHIETKRREPWLFSEATRLAIREAIRRRYKLLPYWYTLFHEHSINGAPVMRPMWYEFPEEEYLFTEERQWLVGNALLIRPVVEKDVYSVQINLPNDGRFTRWFDWETGKEYAEGRQTVAAPIVAIPVFQRGGTIVPTWDRIRRSTAGMIDDPLTLIVALSGQNWANGSVYVDDGKTHDYRTKAQFAFAIFNYKTVSAGQALMTGEPRKGGLYEAKNWLEKIVIRGIKQTPKNITIIRASNPSEELEFDYNSTENVLIIRKPNVVITTQFRIKILF